MFCCNNVKYLHTTQTFVLQLILDGFLYDDTFCRTAYKWFQTCGSRAFKGLFIIKREQIINYISFFAFVNFCKSFLRMHSAA